MPKATKPKKQAPKTAFKQSTCTIEEVFNGSHVGNIEQLTTNALLSPPEAFITQQIHYLGTKSMNYEPALNSLLNANKRIVAITTTNEHLIVVTEG